MKCGKTEPTNDAQYKELKRRHQELYRHVKYSTVHVKNYMSNMIAMGYSCGRIGEDSIMFKDQNSTTAFSNAMNRLEEGAREMADQNMIKLIEMFQMKLDDLRDLKREMKEREKLKLDYDSALRKLDLVREKGQVADISRREVKLKVADEKLNASTHAIVKHMEYYESIRSNFLDNEMEKFRQTQAQYFSFCATTFDYGNLKLAERETMHPEVSSP